MEVQKLTDWTKEPTVLDLKDDLQAAKPSHDDQSRKIGHWNDLRNITGTVKMGKIKGRSSVQPKLIRRQAEWRYSALSEPFLSSDKLFNVDPRTFEDKFAADQNELLLNYQFDTKLNKVNFIDEYIRTNVDEGTAVTRVGWERITEPRMKEVPIFQYMSIVHEEEMQMLQQAAQMKEENPNGYLDLPEELRASVDYMAETGTPVSASIVGTEQVQEDKIIENHPTVEILHPDNVFLDPTANGDYTKANFIVISYETSKAELIKDGRFKNLDHVNWSANSVLAEPDHYSSTPLDYATKDDLRKKVVAYEYWGNIDIEGKDTLTPITATWIGDTMVRMALNPFPDQKPPFVISTYLPVKRKVFGEPDAEILEDNQAILGALTRGMVDSMGRSANAQQGFSKNFLDVTNKRRFDAGKDYEFNQGSDPRTNIYQHTYPEIPQSAVTMINLQNQEAEALSGVKAFAGGVSGDSYGDVATGIKGALDASSKREMNILRRMASGIRAIGSKIAAMNAVFLSEEEVVRVTNKKFVPVRREDLKGNFDLKVDISTAEVDEQKSNDLGFMLQTMGPKMAPAMSQMILGEIADLKRMPVLAEQIRRFKPEPDPMEEQLKMLEMEKLKMEVAKLQSEVELNNARAMEVETEAVLQKIEAENESNGINHKRALQIQKGQANGNASLEVTKSLLKPTKEGEKAPDVETAIGYNQLAKMLDTPAPQPE
ncbi:MAG: hypothetical protein JKY54_01910 [Flavobacteriales bacterium]|nr:hypothetical protein [Flavobacteriales bacterium]